MAETSHPFSIKRMLAEFSATNKRQFAHDRSKSVGGSEVGQCLRKTWLTKKGHAAGFEPDADFEQSSGATDRGTVYENEIWAPAMKAHRPVGSKLLFAGDQQETLRDGDLTVTPDGLFVNLPRDCLAHLGIPDIGGQYGRDDDEFGCLAVECKTIDPRVNLRGKPKAENEFQVKAQLGAIRAATRLRPNFGIISYTNASFMDDVQEFVVPFDAAIYDVAKKRAALIFATCDPKKLAPEGKLYGSNDCDYCAFKSACNQITLGSIPAEPVEPDLAALPVDLDARFEDLARQVATQQEAQDLAERGKKLAQQAIKDLLREAGRPRVTTAMLSKISWAPQAGRKSYDMEALGAACEKAGIDLSDFESIGASFDRLNVVVYSPDEVADKRAAEAAETAARADRERERAEKAAAKEAERLEKERVKAEKAAAKEVEKLAKAASKSGASVPPIN